MNPSSAEELTEQLVLARLFVPAPKDGNSKSKVLEDIYKLLKNRLSQAEQTAVLDSALKSLEANKFIAMKPFGLTDDGQEHAMKLWGIPKNSSRVTWKSIQQTYIAPRLCGLHPDAIKKAKDKADTFASALLQIRYGLPADASPPGKILDALAWKQLNLPPAGKLTAKAVVSQAVLKKQVSGEPGAIRKLLARKLLDSTDRDLFTAAIQSAVDEHLRQSSHTRTKLATTDSAHGTSDLDLRGFASAALAAAKQSPSGHFGDNKTFISHAWRQLTSQHHHSADSLDEFKNRLLSAHRKGLVVLTRADLVERMDPRDIAESEIVYLGSTFHFISL